MEEKSGAGIVYRMNLRDQEQLIAWLRDGNAIGETVTLTVTDNYNRFDLGTVTARIEKWTPAPLRTVMCDGKLVRSVDP